MLNVYGIKNCDVCRNALRWLQISNIEFTFLDLRKDGIERSTLERWINHVGWEGLINRRGTTWRQLSQSRKANLSELKTIKLVQKFPTLLRRPLFESKGVLIQGFKQSQKAELLRWF